MYLSYLPTKFIQEIYLIRKEEIEVAMIRFTSSSSLLRGSSFLSGISAFIHSFIHIRVRQVDNRNYTMIKSVKHKKL